MAKYRVMIAQFPFGASTHPDVADWVTETVVKCREDARIGPGNVGMWRVDSTPVTGSRNACLEKAKLDGFDFVLMVDSDMAPDYELFATPKNPDAKPFWESSFDFALKHDGPCIVAAPYCGPPPMENPYYFKWVDCEGDLPKPNCSMQLEAWSRNEAAAHKGMVRCAALPTGLMLIDMRGIAKMVPPYFYYEWKGDGAKCSHGMNKPGVQTTRASTEDVTFSRDATYAGVPLYANCDSWSGHWKMKCVLKPMPMHQDAVPRWMVDRAKELALAELKSEGFDSEVVPLHPAIGATSQHGALIGMNSTCDLNYAKQHRHQDNGVLTR